MDTSGAPLNEFKSSEAFGFYIGNRVAGVTKVFTNLESLVRGCRSLFYLPCTMLGWDMSDFRIKQELIEYASRLGLPLSIDSDSGVIKLRTFNNETGYSDWRRSCFKLKTLIARHVYVDEAHRPIPDLHRVRFCIWIPPYEKHLANLTNERPGQPGIESIGLRKTYLDLCALHGIHPIDTETLDIRRSLKHIGNSRLTFIFAPSGSGKSYTVSKYGNGQMPTGKAPSVGTKVVLDADMFVPWPRRTRWWEFMSEGDQTKLGLFHLNVLRDRSLVPMQNGWHVIWMFNPKPSVLEGCIISKDYMYIPLYLPRVMDYSGRRTFGGSSAILGPLSSWAASFGLCDRFWKHTVRFMPMRAMLITLGGRLRYTMSDSYIVGMEVYTSNGYVGVNPSGHILNLLLTILAPNKCKLNPYSISTDVATALSGYVADQHAPIKSMESTISGYSFHNWMETVAGILGAFIAFKVASKSGLKFKKGDVLLFYLVCRGLVRKIALTSRNQLNHNYGIRKFPFLASHPNS